MKKRVLVLALVALLSFGGIAAAQEGIYVGAEIGAETITPSNSGVLISPFVGFTSSSLIDNFYFDGRLTANVGPLGGAGGSGLVLGINAYVDLMYTMPLGGVNGLGFGAYLGLTMDRIIGSGAIETTIALQPRVRYEMGMPIGDFYAQLDVPVTIKNGTTLGIALWTGVFMDSGLGLELGLAGKSSSGLASAGMTFTGGMTLNSINFRPSYDFGFLLASAQIVMPLSGFSSKGLDIIPRAEMSLDVAGINGIKFWAEIPVGRIGAGGSPSIGFTLGASFYF